MGRKNAPTHINSAKKVNIKNRSEKSQKQILRESWFNKKTFHYAYEETNPYIYAMACVEIVATHSKEGGMIFSQIITDGTRLHVPGGHHGLVQPVRTGMEVIKYA